MPTAGIAIDPWKKEIFTRHLEAAGLKVHSTVDAGLVLILKVACDDLSQIAPIVEAANAECKERKLH